MADSSNIDPLMKPVQATLSKPGRKPRISRGKISDFTHVPSLAKGLGNRLSAGGASRLSSPRAFKRATGVKP